MKRFLTFLKVEGKLSLRSPDGIIFGIGMPVGVLLLIAVVAGSQSAGGADYSFLQSAFASLLTVGICATAFMGLPLTIADYRDKKATLAYNGLSFSVPKRVHIIGMMNTADRSLAMIDYALRRRFSFFDMEPGFDSEGFINYQNSFANDTFNTLIDRINELNREIANDKSLGKGFCIGHSYFCNTKECTDEWMQDVVDFDILPMLAEYWFDDTDKLQRWENILHGVFQ